MKYLVLKTRFVLVLLLILLVAGLLSLYPSPKRSFVGRVVRFCAGHGLAVQALDDLAEDVAELDGLQDWAVETLSRYRDREIATAGPARNCPGPQGPQSVQLAQSEVPAFIRKAWWISPEVVVVVSQQGNAEAIGLCWYDFGVFVGPPEYPPEYSRTTGKYTRQPKPGIYAYHLYR